MFKSGRSAACRPKDMLEHGAERKARGCSHIHLRSSLTKSERTSGKAASGFRSEAAAGAPRLRLQPKNRLYQRMYLQTLPHNERVDLVVFQEAHPSKVVSVNLPHLNNNWNFKISSTATMQAPCPFAKKFPSWIKAFSTQNKKTLVQMPA